MNELINGEEKHLRSFMPSPFIAASLPLRKITKGYFERKYNNISLSITGTPTVPYGNYGRLILSLLTTHAVIGKRNDDGTVTVRFNNMEQLLNELLIVRQRGKDVMEMLEFFSKSSFVYECRQTRRVQNTLFDDEEIKKDIEVTKYNSGNIPFLDSFEYLYTDVEKKTRKGLAFTINISSKFVELCMDHSVPIDYTEYSSIVSSMERDLYVWFIYRNNILKDNEEIFITRENIVRQFANYERSENHEEDLNRQITAYSRIKDCIYDIKMNHYTTLKVSYDAKGVTLRKSENLITSNDQRYILLTNGLL